MAVIDIIVPCYNEEEMLPRSAPVLLDTLRGLVSGGLADGNSRLLFVDDGSSDGTWGQLEALASEHPEVCALKLSRNRGHQNAVMAGLVTAAKRADATVTIDADLQDDPAAIREMAARFAAGAQVVCGVRRSRASDTVFKRVTARGFYLLVALGGAKVVFDHADFRLLSREAVERLCRFGTEDLFLRGLVTRLGFPIEKVYYDRAPRLAGESKYTLKKMLHLARRGFESGRMKPADRPRIGELYIEKELLQ
ncbi:MAG: glycosyltransferase family 2 protein [Oscillospiraceae bacterium]|nr:glycosyltransferase family 2 protein [Oscillospiraceae bacterium]